MDTKADMDGAMVELPGGIEAIRALDSAQTEGARIEARSEQLRKKEMRHHRAIAFYDCLKFVNEAFFSVLAIGLSVLLALRGAITAGYGAHGLPVLYPAHRPASGAAPHIGIVGPSGCGKSSLIKVIDKLEEAQGEVLLGGVPLDSLSRTVLAANVALVPQTPFLIADTVYHNICYGMKREVSPEEVREAVRKAGIAADIEHLEGGCQFVLAEGGPTSPAVSASASRWPASSSKNPAS